MLYLAVTEQLPEQFRRVRGNDLVNHQVLLRQSFRQAAGRGVVIVRDGRVENFRKEVGDGRQQVELFPFLPGGTAKIAVPQNGLTGMIAVPQIQLIAVSCRDTLIDFQSGATAVHAGHEQVVRVAGLGELFGFRRPAETKVGVDAVHQDVRLGLTYIGCREQLATDIRLADGVRVVYGNRWHGQA